MKVLSVAPWVPWDVRPRSAGLLSIAAEHHEVRLLALARGGHEAAHAGQVPGLAGVQLVGNPRLASALRVARAVRSDRPLQSAYADVPALRHALEVELDRWQPDLVHLNVARTAHLLPLLTDVPVVIDLDERRSSYFEQLGAQRAGRSPWARIGRMEAPRLERLEAALVHSGVAVLLSSTADLRPGENSHVVPSPLDLDRWAPPPGREGLAGRTTMLFVGRLHQRANHEALQWFVDECLPRIPAARRPLLDVVGEAPPRSIRRLHSADGDRPDVPGGIRVRGFVPSVERAYDTARMALVPVRTGTGVQMKLIQALAAGVPAITTSACASRARLVPGRDVLVADTPEAWAAAVELLATDDVLWHRLGQAGRAAVAALHGRAAVADQLELAYAAARPPWVGGVSRTRSDSLIS